MILHITLNKTESQFAFISKFISNSGQLTKAAEDREARKKDALLKSQRRKSTPSSLLSSNLDSLKIEDIDNIVLEKLKVDEPETEQEKKDEPEVSPEMKKSDITKSRENVEENKASVLATKVNFT